MHKPRAGQPISHSARDWAQIVDAVKRDRDSRLNQSADLDLPELSQTKILVKNESGGALPRFSILALGEPWQTPDDDLPQFQRQIVFRGDEPGVYHDAPRDGFCVLLEPAQANDVVEAVAFGLVPVLLDVRDAAHGYAEVKDSSSAKLQTCNTSHAAARIIWKEPGTGDQWAVVAIGNSESPGMVIAKLPSGGIPRRKFLRPGSAVCELWKMVPLVPGSQILLLTPRLLAGGTIETARVYNLSPKKIKTAFARVDHEPCGYWVIDCPCDVDQLSSSSDSSSSQSSSSDSSSSRSSSSGPSSSQSSSSVPSSSEQSSSGQSSSQPSSSGSSSASTPSGSGPVPGNCGALGYCIWFGGPEPPFAWTISQGCDGSSPPDDDPVCVVEIIPPFDLCCCDKPTSPPTGPDEVAYTTCYGVDV